MMDNIGTRVMQIMEAVRDNVFNASIQVYDPLILDLDGDGFNIETIANGTNFDLDKNGFAEKINWTTKDGFSTKLNVKPS